MKIIKNSLKISRVEIVYFNTVEYVSLNFALIFEITKVTIY